jgi:hypothetical protein
MKDKLLHPATIISLIALFVALSGTSYAISQLPKNSVGTKQLKNNAVTSPKVKDGSLLSKDFKAGQLPQGEPGPQGEIGPSDAYAVTQADPVSLVADGEVKFMERTVPAGKYSISSKVDLRDSSGSSKRIDCWLVAFDGGSSTETDHTMVEMDGNIAHFDSCTNMMTHEFASAGTIKLAIVAAPGTSGLALLGQMNAIRLNNLDEINNTN